MRSRSCCRAALAGLPAVLWGASLLAQTFGGMQVARVMPQPPVALKPGEEAVVPLKIRIRSRYHINSHQPAEDYLIPTALRWSAPGFKLKRIAYPEAESVTYAYSTEPLLVYSGTIEIRSTFAVPPSLPADLTDLRGTLRYQACNDKACLPPKTLEVKVPVQVP